MLLVHPQEGSATHNISMDFANLKDIVERCFLEFNSVFKLSKEGRNLNILDKLYRNGKRELK